MKKTAKFICLLLAAALLPLGAFASEAELTRAEFLARLFAETDIRERIYAGSFSDVSSADAFADMAEGALAAGIIEGGAFRPQSAVTGAEAAAMAAKALEHNLAALPEGPLFAETAAKPVLSDADADALLTEAAALAASLPLRAGDEKTTAMLNYVRENIDAFEAENEGLGAKAREYYDDAVNRFINGSEEDRERAAELTALAYGAMLPERHSFLTGTPLYDNNGGLVQAHGGGVLWDEKTKKYYWYGEARGASVVPANLQKYADWGWRIGVACYSSADLYNWTYEGLALEMIENDDEAPLEYPESDIRVGEVIERPKVIYNDKTGKYVMWMHIDNGWYGYSRAGVAVADSPVGPFTYLESSRPGDKMSRDMTVFKDDDGAAYIYFSTDENSSLAVCRLSEDYLSCEGEAVYCISGGWREAPALFRFKDTYYMITSGCTGWDPNAADYATAPSPLGPWTRHGSPMRGEGAELTFGGQSAFVLPVDAEKGHFIFIADTWRPSHHDESGFIWLPVQIRDDGSIRIDWFDEWTLDDLGAKIIEPETVFATYGEEVELPELIKITGEGYDLTGPADWNEGSGMGLPGHYYVEGKFRGDTEPKGLLFADAPVTAEVYNTPANLIYFADCGASDTTEFDVISGVAALDNSVPDQSFGPDEKTGKSWGYIADNAAGARNDANMYSSVRYDYGGGIGEGVSYKFAVESGGSYDVFIGLYDPWGEKARREDVYVQGFLAEEGIVPADGRVTVASTGLPAPTGEITVSVRRNALAADPHLDPLVSWIMVAEAGGVNPPQRPVGLTYPEPEPEEEAAPAEATPALYSITAAGGALGYDPEKPMREALTFGAEAPQRLWTLRQTLSGAYIIESSADFEVGDSTEKRALDVLNHDSAAGVSIIVYRTAGGENQRWFLEKQPSGAYMLKSELSGLYLTTKDGKLTQERAGAEGDQLWKIELAE